jgi:O-methyltransferase
MSILVKIIQKIMHNSDYHISRIENKNYSKQERDIFKIVSPYTLTKLDTIQSLIDSVKYLTKNNIEGDFIECGVWKGGSIMTMIKTLQELNVNDRNIFLYDTFTGMSKPTSEDIASNGRIASELFTGVPDDDPGAISLEEVQRNVSSLNYDENKIHYIKGKVEDTLPKNTHEKIALLRLDTDWYESTKCELELLFPKLVKGGILIIDDYGDWDGSKKATKEYLKENGIKMMLHRLPGNERIAIKIT